MSKEQKNIDNFFKERLGNLEADTSRNLWKKLYWMVISNKVLFGIFVLLLVSAGFLFFFNTSGNKQIATPAYQPVITTTETNSISKTEIQSETNSEINTTINKENKNNKSSNTSTATKSNDNKTITYDNNLQDFSAYTQNKTSFTPGKKLIGKSSLKKIEIIHFQYFELKVIIPPNISDTHYPAKYQDVQNGDNKGDTTIKQESHWSADIFVNPVYVTTRLTGDNMYNSYIADRSNSEKDIFTVGASAGISYSIGRFLIKSGLEYASYGQDGNYTHTTDEIDSRQSYYGYDTTWAWVYDPPEIYPYPIAIDSTFFPVYKTENTTTKNSYSYLEIPLLIGYQFGNDKKVSFEISTGCSFGFLISAKGKIPSPDDNSLLELNKSSAFIRSSSVNYIAQLEIGFRLSDNTKFVVRPFYKRSLTSTVENSFPVNQKFNTFGLSFGIKIKF